MKLILILIATIFGLFSFFDQKEPQAKPPSFTFDGLAVWQGVPAELLEVAAVDSKLPPNVECKDGKCSIVRRPVATTTTMTVIGAETQTEHRFNGPIARSARLTGDVARAVGWRLTHPFGGRFRR